MDEDAPVAVTLLRQLFAASGLTADLRLCKAAGSGALLDLALPLPFQVSLKRPEWQDVAE